MGREGSGDEFMGTGKKGVGMGKVGWDLGEEGKGKERRNRIK